MSNRRPAPRRAAPGLAWLCVLAAGAALGACAEVEATTASGYEPAAVDAKSHRVTFTSEGARRTGLRTALVRHSGSHLVVPYEAIVYDGRGSPHVYTVPEPLTFQRTPVSVERIADGRALLNAWPPVGTRVVTTGATQVYGTERGIDGGH